MNYRDIAKVLGRRGGLKRAQNLSSNEKARIARMGAKARVESLKAATRVETNFKYLEAIRQLQPPPKVKSVKSIENYLPPVTYDPQTYLDVVGQIIEKLEAHNLAPVLVGGMALVILGSQRVTKDFDFLISEEARNLEMLMQIFYHHGLELVSKINKQGEVITTIDNQKIAYGRLQLDKPDSAYFYNHKTGLRVDLLFDFPLTAIEVAKKAQKKKIHSRTFTIASKNDLIRLKEIAYQNRKLASDAQDLEFLNQI